MATSAWKLSVAGALTLAALTSTARAQERVQNTLPLRTVRLYEVGLGYFERTGRLGKGPEVALPVPATHLDDALKTLVILGEGGKASVTGVEFSSSVSPSMGRALAGLPEGEDSITYPQLLRGLKGASVDLKTTREALRGRLIDVVEPAVAEAEECAPVTAAPGSSDKGDETPHARAPSPCAPSRQLTLLILTDRGELRRLRASEVIGVRPTDPAFAARIGSGLDAISTQGAATRKPLRVLAQSATPVTLGYVAETPVWRSSYRLVLDDAGGGVMQGWALVHNDTDEDWKQVRVELVNGQPSSFLFPLAAPRYGRRELVTPDEALSTVPQLHGRTVDSMWEEQSFGAGGFGLTGIGEGGGGRGEGIGLGQIGTIGHGSGTGSAGPGSTALSIGNLAAVGQAEGVESGVLFRYALPSPIDLRAHGSALLPFLQRAVTARRIAHFNGSGKARSAARLRNDTGQTLPAGPIAFFADGGFAGEATIDRMIPDERRTVAFGEDLDVELVERGGPRRDEPRLLEFDGDTLVEHYVRFREDTYEITNKSPSPRTVFVNLGYVTNSRVQGADELDFDTRTNKAMAVFQVGAKSQRAAVLKVEEGLRRSIGQSAWSSKNLTALSEVATLPATQRAALRAAAAEMRIAEQWRDALPKVEQAITSVRSELDRLRGYLSAAKTGSDGAETFTKRILAAEDRLTALRAQAEKFVVQRKRRAALSVASLAKLSRPAVAR
ncbi:hypothetical protein [Chondromyces apiculatus]|uniref:DUF4139 domain-containing protein n=1 Tax=Chondromyces apiculatus DSM 436 TaxID=1192034 RepID=A0A017SWG6_9BACT|nr:hypothetical protein [Chondromyces apiculatus]EYF00646.1 Hypothetical protein CAP_0399 [Chondromyces apiculatus DSM 436]